MATATTTTGPHERTRGAAWSPARVYLVASGAFLLVVAAAGFALNQNFATGPDYLAGHDATAHVFGILETNGWHTLAGLLSALVALGFALRPEWARAGALVKGVFYTGVTAGIALWGPEPFWIASNAADQVVHATLAVTGLATGLATRPQRHARS